MFYDSRPLNEDLNMRIQRRDAKAYEEKERGRVLSESMAERRNAQRNMQIKYSDFIENSKTALLTEAIFYCVNECFGEEYSISDRKKAESLVYNFVKEEGASSLLSKYAVKTELLANIANIVNEAHSCVKKETSCCDASVGYQIKKSTTDDFYGKLRELPIDNITKRITDNVSKQTQDFVTQQVKDNERIEDLAKQTKEKIDKVRNNNKETEEAIKQEYANFYKRSINDIRYRRPRTVFEEMVYHISEKVVKDTNILQESYQNNDGTFNVDKVIKEVSIMYTVLECMNTMKFREFAARDIKEIIDNI